MISKTLYRVVQILPEKKPHQNDPKVAVEYFAKEEGPLGSWLQVSTQEAIQVLGHALTQHHVANHQARHLLSEVVVGNPD